jgi:hypothetical protein
MKRTILSLALLATGALIIAQAASIPVDFRYAKSLAQESTGIIGELDKAKATKDFFVIGIMILSGLIAIMQGLNKKNFMVLNAGILVCGALATGFAAYNTAYLKYDASRLYADIQKAKSKASEIYRVLDYWERAEKKDDIAAQIARDYNEINDLASDYLGTPAKGDSPLPLGILAGRIYAQSDAPRWIGGAPEVEGCITVVGKGSDPDLRASRGKAISDGQAKIAERIAGMLASRNLGGSYAGDMALEVSRSGRLLDTYLVFEGRNAVTSALMQMRLDDIPGYIKAYQMDKGVIVPNSREILRIFPRKGYSQSQD